MKSMTGYGVAKSSQRQLELEVSIKAVNGRFLDIRLHGPREYDSLELEIKKRIRQVFRRGTLIVNIGRSVGPAASSTDVTVNERVLKQWIKAHKRVETLAKADSKVLSAMQLAALPGVCEVHHKEKVSSQEKALFFKTLDMAIRRCDNERRREGRALSRMLLAWLAELKSQTQRMGQLRSQAHKHLKQKMHQRLKGLGLKETIDAQRLAQEVVIQLDKTDINEELQRLQEHIRVCLKLVRSKESEGKKIDFYTQELLREVNTIGSKSQLAALTERVVDSKAMIERLREQVQNVE